MRVIGDTRVPVKVWATDLEAEAEMQARRIADLPFVYKHVALMPDAHAGKGSTVGTVIATKGAIIPAAIGVDIGCGMAAAKLPFDMNYLNSKVALKDLRHSIERSVPTGRFGNKAMSERVQGMWASLGKPRQELDERILRNAALQLGTLGGGNHFIEICSDKAGGAWVMLHSGSRNIGKVLAERHIERAKGLMKQYFINLPDPDLSYLAQNTPEFNDYIKDLFWAQTFAMHNRAEMMFRVLKDIGFAVGLKKPVDPDYAVFCHHNYTTQENHYGQNVWITRKGAVSARAGEIGIIPGSMGTKSYIVRGLGNPESFCSCSHGAGRRMSRTKARQTFTTADLASQTEGVECRKDDAILDEIPGSYKDIDQVMANQADLVEVLYELKAVICVKGA